MNKIIYIFFLLLLNFSVKAQTDTCGTNVSEQAIRALDSFRYDGRMLNFRQVVKYYRSQNPTGSHLPNPSVTPPCSTCIVTGPNCPKTKFVIPVVVHVVYNNSTTNIADAQIEHQIEELNRDYSNYDLTGSPAVNTGIQFVLASKDINGNTITGITRHNNSSLAVHEKITESPALEKEGLEPPVNFKIG